MTLKEQLLRDAAQFCRSTGMSKARLATIVVNDGKFFDRIGSGGEFTTATFEKFQRHFSENRPGGRQDSICGDETQMPGNGTRHDGPL